MTFRDASVIAGFISTLLFASSNIPMLLKAIKTRDLGSYSPGYLVLSNIGNLIHWVYIISLPLGPIWLLHGFFSVSCGLMLIWYIRYEGIHISQEFDRILSAITEEVFSRLLRSFKEITGCGHRGCSCWAFCLCGPATACP